MNIHTDLPLKKKTLIMGIVNVTPDSFSDGGRFLEPAAAIARGMGLAAEGADILDLGAESTRPGSEPVSAEKQIERLQPVVEELRRQVNIPLSIDTTQAQVAREILDLGADMINDISGLQFDPEMGSVVAERNCPVVIMHILDTPKNMQQHPQYADVIEEIRAYFVARIEWAHHAGITDQQIILDPGQSGGGGDWRLAGSGYPSGARCEGDAPGHTVNGCYSKTPSDRTLMEIFRIGFITVTLIDVIDILAIAWLFYQLYLIFRGTRAAQMLMGLVVIMLASFVFQALNFSGMSWILRNIQTIWVIAFVILFQPELRRVLIFIGQNRLFQKIIPSQVTKTVDEVVDAAIDLSKKRWGA
ncbi:MAG: dihydropteroate synthase, partial [Calditrichota bacterium]